MKKNYLVITILFSLAGLGAIIFFFSQSTYTTNESNFSPAAPPELPDSFSPDSREYINDELGFSLSYPSDISIDVTTSTITLPGPPNKDAVRLSFAYREIPLTSVTFSGGSVSSASSSWWHYDSTNDSFTFQPYWAKSDTPCPTYFLNNKDLPVGITSFGDAGDQWNTYHFFLGGRTLELQVSDYDFEFAYRHKSAEEKDRARLTKQVGDSLRQQILESFMLIKDTARSFACSPRSA